MFGLSYWFLPLFAGCVWLGTLLAMLGRWAYLGTPQYAWENERQHIAYISDIAATNWGYPLFIAGSAVTVVTFDLAFVAERWLRHRGRLTQNYGRGEKFLSVCAIIAAIIGAAGLILLTIFDIKNYDHVHDAMLVVFIVGYIVSAIFICAEYQRLGIHYRDQRILAASFWIKLAFIFVEVALAVAFGVESYKHHYNTAAVIEWVISLIYIFYIWSFIIDFLPATRTKHKRDRYPPPLRKQDDEMAMHTQQEGNMMGGPVYTNGGHYPDAPNGTNGGGYANDADVDANGRYFPYNPTNGNARNF